MKMRFVNCEGCPCFDEEDRFCGVEYIIVTQTSGDKSFSVSPNCELIKIETKNGGSNCL